MSADLPRNPLCAPPAYDTPRAGRHDMIDKQAARIVELEGQLASARGKVHDANNRIQAAEGALEMIGSLLGLDASASPPQVLAAAMARLK